MNCRVCGRRWSPFRVVLCLYYFLRHNLVWSESICDVCETWARWYRHPPLREDSPV